MRDSSNDTIGSTRVRHDSDGAVRMDEESDRGSPIHSENGAESEDGGEDQGGGSNLGKVRAISSFSSAHGGSTSVLVSPTLMPFVPLPISFPQNISAPGVVPVSVLILLSAHFLFHVF